MTATVQDIVDAVVADLTGNVDALREASVHRYAPWNPEELFANVGDRHLAVWPVADQVEQRNVLTSDAHELNQVYVILIWENASDAQSRRVADEAADLAFIEMWEAVRDRFYEESNQWLGGTERTWYTGSRWADASGTNRWVLVEFACRLYSGFRP